MHQTKINEPICALSSSKSGASVSKTNFVCLKSYVDSGAARSACPKDFAAQFETEPTEASRNGSGFRTATGKLVPNMGKRVVMGETGDGRTTGMSYVVADIAVALDSVSQICDNGAQVVFTKYGGHILSDTGDRVEFERTGDTYTRSVYVPLDQNFQRPRQ